MARVQKGKPITYDLRSFENFDQDISAALNAQGIFSRSDIRDATMFNTHGFHDPYKMMGRTFEYVFFTKPDLNICSSSGNLSGPDENAFSEIPIFVEAAERYPEVLRELQSSLDGHSRMLSALLYNHRTSPLDLPDIEANDEETSENMWGNKVVYRRSSMTADDNYDFSVEFRDTRYLDVYMYFRLYDLYENRKSLGLAQPNKKYIQERRLHDQTSIYKFIVGEDGKRLIYWAKYYGVYPKGAPRGAFNNLPEDGDFKFSVNFKANFVTDMDPVILADFNVLAEPYGPRTARAQYNPDAGLGGQTSWFSPGPFIRPLQKASAYKNAQYELVWR